MAAQGGECKGPSHVCGVFAPEKGLDHTLVNPVPCESCDAEMCEACPRPVCRRCHRSLLACLRCASKMDFTCMACLVDAGPVLNVLKAALPAVDANVLRLVAEFPLGRCQQGQCDPSEPFEPAWRCNMCLQPSCAVCAPAECTLCDRGLRLCTRCLKARITRCPTCRAEWGSCHQACVLVPMRCCNDVDAPMRCIECGPRGAPACAYCKLVLCPKCVQHNTRTCDGCHETKLYCPLHWYQCPFSATKGKVLCAECRPFLCKVCNRTHCYECTRDHVTSEHASTEERSKRYHERMMKRRRVQ